MDPQKPKRREKFIYQLSNHVDCEDVEGDGTDGRCALISPLDLL